MAAGCAATMPTSWAPDRWKRVRPQTASDCDFTRQHNPPALAGRWNSLAVMFELRCSKFEIFCSESGGQPQYQGLVRFPIPYDSVGCGVDLNHRPLGYEGNSFTRP